MLPRRRGNSPLFIIDSHPVDVCRPIRAGKKIRLDGLVQRGWCASVKRWYQGVREHLIFTPKGHIALVLQLPGHRHDIQGLYALLKTSFRGRLLGDNAYWPHKSRRPQLAAQGITVTAADRSNWKEKNTAAQKRLLKKWRPTVERRIALLNHQFHAGRTLCRSRRHYEARRWAKVMAHNMSRYLNHRLHRPPESVQHFRLVA